MMPFKAYRPPPSIAASLAAPPYDVISSDEARKLADGNEYSFLRVRAVDLEREKSFDWVEMIDFVDRQSAPCSSSASDSTKSSFLNTTGEQAGDRPARQHLVVRPARLRAGGKVS